MMQYRLFLFFLWLPLMSWGQASEVEKEAIEMAQKQLDAYNARDIEAFVACYADSVEIYNFPGQLIMQGREAMREGYAGFFTNNPQLHCELINRISIGNKVIDREKVTGAGPEPFHALAIYIVEGGLIQKVYFMRP